MQHARFEISGDRFSDPDYADDIAAIGADLPQLTGTLGSIEGACCELGLHILWVAEDQDTKRCNRPARSKYHRMWAAG